MSAAMKATRYELGSVDQIPLGEGRTFAVGGRRIAVFHGRDGQLHATQADCPHKGGPLADGLVGGGSLICPLHERRFDLATGASQDGSCQIAIFPVTRGPGGNVTVEVPELPV
jgi:nitrite reductase (NADH) small subunit